MYAVIKIALMTDIFRIRIISDPLYGRSDISTVFCQPISTSRYEARKCKKGMHTRLLGKCNLLQLDVNGHLGAKSSPFRLSSAAGDKTFDRRSLVRSPFRAIFTEKLCARSHRNSSRNSISNNDQLSSIYFQSCGNLIWK